MDFPTFPSHHKLYFKVLNGKNVLMLEPKRVAFKRKCRAEQRQTDCNKVFKMCRSYTMCWEAGVKTTVISTMNPDSKPPQQQKTEKDLNCSKKNRKVTSHFIVSQAAPNCFLALEDALFGSSRIQS